MWLLETKLKVHNTCTSEDEQTETDLLETNNINKNKLKLKEECTSLQENINMMSKQH